MQQFKERYIKELNIRLEDLKEAICFGKPESFSEDESLRGQIQAFQIALDEFDRIWSVFFSDQEELIND